MTRRVFRWVAVLAAGLLVACGGVRGPGAGPGSNTFSHPTGSAQLVLRVDTVGGFVPPQVLVTRVPDFSLFGDGTVVMSGPMIEIYPGPALPNLLQRRLTEDGIQRILRAARRAGLLGPNRRFNTMTVSDLPSTVFTLVANGRRHVVSVYGLGQTASSPQMSPQERQARKALLRLERQLFDLSSWLLPASLSEERPFAPDALRLFVQPYRTVLDSSLHEPAVTWPLGDALSTFGRTSSDLPGGRCGTVAGGDARRVLAVARRANQLTPWVSRGRAFGITFRPLLPDESGC